MMSGRIIQAMTMVLCYVAAQVIIFPKTVFYVYVRNRGEVFQCYKGSEWTEC